MSGNGMVKPEYVPEICRRNAPVHVEWIDDSVTVLAFTLHQSDVIALLDDGSLRRWRRLNSGWREISRAKGIGGRESFRLHESRRGRGGWLASTQLGYNDAIAVNQTSIFYGVGKILQQMARS